MVVVGSLNAIRNEGAIVLPSTVEGFAHSQWPKGEVYPRIVFVQRIIVHDIHTNIYIYTNRSFASLVFFSKEGKKEGKRIFERIFRGNIAENFPTFLGDPM